MPNYPTELQLNKIRNFYVGKENILEFLSLIEEVWEYDGFYYNSETNILELHTLGWSGNEDIIEAIAKNVSLFWMFAWWKSRRGGHFTFDLSTYFSKSKPVITLEGR